MQFPTCLGMNHAGRMAPLTFRPGVRVQRKVESDSCVDYFAGRAFAAAAFEAAAAAAA